jgi:hypothetical protein
LLFQFIENIRIVAQVPQRGSRKRVPQSRRLFGAKSARERFVFAFEKADMANGETYLCHHGKDEREENKCSLTLDHHHHHCGVIDHFLGKVHMSAP